MGDKLRSHIETWKKLLLDYGKSNRLINFKEGKRTNVQITAPSYNRLFELITVREKRLTFSYAQKTHFDDNGEESYDEVIKGDIETSKSISDLQKTLKILRQKANTSLEERGINTLYLAFGLLIWTEREDSNQVFSSPIVLVPVKLIIESLIAPYKLSSYDDEIVINPTLLHKLDNDFGIKLPEFDGTQDDIVNYLDKLESTIRNKDWIIERCVHLTHFSFLKINMYKDLERNEAKLHSNPIISAIAGERECLHVSASLENFDHDKEIRPIDTFQVVDADSSQQDAILLAKRGVSYVLQGPPGTGKSQTITNIISEAIAEGKKVLFVSEKMAALQVVYNRLVNAGLGDFCFTLHNHKANKKEILRELANSISIDRKKVTEEALSQLYNLERKRAELNEYQQQLHTPCSGLKKTIFEVNGLLANLSDVPDVIFEIENIEKITTKELENHIYLLRELSKTINKRSTDIIDNVWRNSNVKFLSNELRHDIDSNISTLLPLLQTAEHIFDECNEKLDLSIDKSINGLNSIIKVLTVAQESPIIPVKWILNEDLDHLLEEANEYKVLFGQISAIQKELESKYTEKFFNCDGKQIKEKFTELIIRLSNIIKSETNGSIADNASVIYSKLSKTITVIDEIYHNAIEIADCFGISKPSNFGQIRELYHLSKLIASSTQIIPVAKWFDAKSFRQIQQTFSTCRIAHEELVSLKKTLLQTCDREILSEDFYPMLQRFRSDYNSSLRILKGSFRRDMNHLKHYMHNGSKLTYRGALEILSLLKIITDKSKEIELNQEEYVSNYGLYYNGLDTRWDILQDALESFETIVSSPVYFPAKLRDLYMTSSLPIDKMAAFNKACKLHNLDDIQNEIYKLLKLPLCENPLCEQIITTGRNALSLLDDFIIQYTDMLKLSQGVSNYEILISDIDQLAFLQEKSKLLLKQQDILLMQYDSYYDNEETNWYKLIDALCFAKRFKEVVCEYDLSDSFISKICSDKDSISFCLITLDKLKFIGEKISKPFEWFISLFDNSELFYIFSFAKLSDRLIACKDKKYLLEEWVDYCSYKQKCAEVNLLPYITEFELCAINPDYLINAYLKRFYRLWLDAMLQQFPAILNFRSRTQEQNIKEFCQLDKSQFKIAQARVRERAVSRIPDFSSITSTRDELGILKRELNKQRHLMPLRKLFMLIPNLITSLRPCFMMSPLSVSVFLEAQSYDFDMVIFDEASQVHTEDAIGAIMRGKQTIIVGDSKQLPPTNFFSSSLAEEDFDTTEDDNFYSNNDGAYDSILEEALTVLPERSLLWHYRSRHEHLIAFSNNKIYNGSLITFPTSIENAPDLGVEYIYVPDGVYDRSGTRNNIIEARKVADLVFEHFLKYPNRSLGVVTFSEAQQNAIDTAIRQKRLSNPSYEKFFIEDTEEPFFIKNLETVQGDERDTIIFSIGYAKNQNGIMYMNFGPLSRDGGYRRLNVAITRAKYNVKLVGSITPSDIDIEKTSAEGVKLLRSYIEFAQNGMSALTNELTYSNEFTFDSPFEESVFSFLQAKGYKIATQVGCSGFRIDMAIKHPLDSGRFVIGIECDGATYHSSRTARERDRLRQSILEGMGWSLYRIWSTDWIKDQQTQEEKLISAIENAIENVTNKTPIKDEGDTEIPNEILPIEEVADVSNESKGYGFIEYQRADIYEFSEELLTEDIIKKVIEIEQPIHFEELCRRVAPLFGNQKATSKIRNEVNNIFKYYLKDIIQQKDNFITTVNFDNIQVRIPSSSDGYIRPIVNISDSEISLAMQRIVEKSYGITKENLFIETAHIFGFKRTGDNILYTFKRIYNNMLSDCLFKEIEGKVSIP